MQSVFEFSALGEITDLHSGVRWSADDLRAEIAKRVGFFEKKGVAASDTVMICHGGTPQFFADLFACWTVGACAVCLNASLTKNEICTLTAFVKPAIILIDGDNIAEQTETGVDVANAGVSQEVASLPKRPRISAADRALILFTSGSTGTPKGVVHTGRSLTERLCLNRAHIGDSALRNSLCVLSTHFGHGLIGNCLTPLTAGHHLFLFDNPGIQGFGRLGQLLDEQEITFMSSVPSTWKIATRASGPPRSRKLEHVNIGSAPLSEDLWKSVIEWSGTDNVCNMYGITETANWACGASAHEFSPEDGLIGRPWGGEIAIRNEDGQIVQRGQGEIVLRTPGIMEGYLNRPDLTQEIMQNGWYLTGDFGTIDRNGVAYLSGRIKTQINRAGEKILPEEIDTLLEKHPDVIEACAFGLPDQIQGEMVAVAVRVNGKIPVHEIRKWCGERIRPSCVPEKWYLVEEIPKTDRGKVQRTRVRDHCLSGVGA